MVSSAATALKLRRTTLIEKMKKFMIEKPISTGSDPLTFYKYPVYRNPYRYPYKHYSSYPYPYMTYHPVNL